MSRPVFDVISEKDFLATLVKFAQARGWLVHHVLDTRSYAKRIGPGYPDLTMVRGDRVIFAELKSERGTLSASQHQWLTALREATGVLVFVWQPHDWPAIEKVLE